MPQIPIVVVTKVGTLEQLYEEFAKFQKQVRYWQNKNVDTESIFEVGGWRVTPDQLASADGDVGMSTLDTDEDDIRFFAGPDGSGGYLFYVTKGGLMVAENASIRGTIEALAGHIGGFTIENDRLSSDSGNGIIEGGTIIGAYITTADGTYPRVDLSTTGNIFQAFLDALNYIAVDPDRTGSPTLVFETPNSGALIFPDDFTGQFTLLVTDGNMATNVQSGKYQLAALNDIELLPGGYVKLISWSKLYNGSQTLQQALDAKQDEITSGDVTVIGGVATLGNNISATHLADGSVNNTEFQYINSLTSNAQTQLNTKATVASGGKLLQSDVASITTLAASNNYSVTITFPTPFSAPPVCFPSVAGNGIPNILHAPVLGTVTATTMEVFMFQADAIARTMPIHWFAVGPP